MNERTHIREAGACAGSLGQKLSEGQSTSPVPLDPKAVVPGPVLTRPAYGIEQGGPH